MAEIKGEKNVFDPKNVEIDAEGRIVIKDKKLADKIKKAIISGEKPDAAMLDVNFGCGKK